jgi:hypothetical protein
MTRWGVSIQRAKRDSLDQVLPSAADRRDERRDRRPGQSPVALIMQAILFSIVFADAVTFARQIVLCRRNA